MVVWRVVAICRGPNLGPQLHPRTQRRYCSGQLRYCSRSAQAGSGLLMPRHQQLWSKDQNGNSSFRYSGGSYPVLRREYLTPSPRPCSRDPSPSCSVMRTMSKLEQFEAIAFLSKSAHFCSAVTWPFAPLVISPLRTWIYEIIFTLYGLSYRAETILIAIFSCVVLERLRLEVSWLILSLRGSIFKHGLTNTLSINLTDSTNFQYRVIIISAI